MISEKLNQSLKIGIFLILISTSFLIAKISQACTVFDTLGAGCCGGTSVNCGFSQYQTTDAWLCGIEKVASTYYCASWNCPGSIVDSDGECNVTNVWLKNSGCPDINSYNGNTCIFADSAMNVWSTYHCSEEQDPWKLKGNWDASEKQCVKCDGGLIQLKRLADASPQRCFNFTETAIWPNSNLQWEELACATIPQTCESACGASPECDDAPGGLNVPATHGIGVCNNCVFVEPCSWQNDACGAPCAATERHQTCGPAGCSGGICIPGSTQCIDDLTCHPCEETCTCKCPKDPEGKDVCPCSLGGDCPPELIGGLVPCGRSCNDPCTKSCECCPCTLCHLFVLFKRIVDFLTLNIIFPLAVLMIVVGGVMFLTAGGDPGRIGGAKKILTATVIGLAIILAAWLIVDTVITFLTPAGSSFQNWSTIDCPVCGNRDCESGETSENCPADCGAPPPPVCTSDFCNGNCPEGCGGADDPDCPGQCLDCACATDNDCASSCAAGDGCCPGCAPADPDCPICVNGTCDTVNRRYCDAGTWTPQDDPLYCSHCSHCTDGVKNCSETGIDCGGGGCPACAGCPPCIICP